MDEPALEINNLVKKYGDKVAVDGISFHVKRGEFFGFLGPNGAGKTSTISCITGTARVTLGEIKVFGFDVVKNYRQARKKIGISPQEFNVDIFAKPKDILYFVGGYFGIPKKERLEKIEEVTKELGLEKYMDTPFRALSGGRAQWCTIQNCLYWTNRRLGWMLNCGTICGAYLRI